MKSHHWILIGGAVALLWYAKNGKLLGASSGASVDASNGPNAGATYTTTQAAASAQWWNAYPGSWQGAAV